MGITQRHCNDNTCYNEWPHLHILPLSEVLGFLSLEGDEIADDYIEEKREDSWYPALCSKLDVEGFNAGIHIVDDPEYPKAIKDGHHRLLYCRDRGQYWCPVERNWDINYDYPDEWGAEQYGWVPANRFELSYG